MKTFRFRLDQALRWRATQLDIEKAKVAAAASLLRGLCSELDSLKSELTRSAAAITGGASGTTLQAWPGWMNRCKREIARTEQHAKAAEEALRLSMQRLIEANQDAQLLEKLKASQLARWQAESSRELEAFASETFLRQVTIGNGRARSSVG